MPYSLEAILHKLRPTLLLKFSVQLLLAVPSQRQDPKKCFLAIFGIDHKRETKIKLSYSNNTNWVNMQRLLVTTFQLVS